MNVVIFVVESSDRDDVVDVICDIDVVVDVVIDLVVNAIVDVLVDIIVLVTAPVIDGVEDKDINVIRLAVS